MSVATQTIQQADSLRSSKNYREAIAAYMDAIRGQELPDADVCVKLARCHLQLGEVSASLKWLMRVVDSAEGFLPWQAAGALLDQIIAKHGINTDCGLPIRRNAKLAVLGSYTTKQLMPMLRLAALREGILLETMEGEYGQYQQELLNPSSELFSFQPQFIMLAVNHRDAGLPAFSRTPDEDVTRAVEHWKMLWDRASSSGARIIQHNFALPVETAMGHLSSRLSGTRHAMLQKLNTALGEAAGNRVSIVDCERIASHIGKSRWFDDKYWHIAKQAVALEALPSLARHSVAVLAADLGLSKKCLVLDLDNTMWGGIIGEDGLAGIRLGQGNPDGEAFMAFQDYVLELKAKGVILAVCSKNNDADAREVFLKHPDMRIKLEDLAMFVANWKTKVENIRTIATTLNIGLDSLVFADDNAAEREIIRQMLPEVEVLTLPKDPAGYVRTLSNYLMFETSAFTSEDAEKTQQYRAKAQIAELEAASGSIEDFYRSLKMTAVVQPFDELHLPRIVQLIGKTNQFNLTTRRHTTESIRAIMADKNCAHFWLKLKDRFADHGLVSLIIGKRDPKQSDVMEIDTWLMSCRVIGRTVEAELLSHLTRAAQKMGCTKIRGVYIPTAKNGMVKDIYSQFGFERDTAASANNSANEEIWLYDLSTKGPISNGFISLEQR
ncbi:MAG TPA: HAD-IIIC family phosphatase [Phycisphaerales bacterium]|nr:HAD-IIIC family phosphatase [Phycisphaerales bacterium]